MTTEALKSLSITNLDASPIVPNTVGEGAAGNLRTINDFISSVSGKTVGSTYRFARVPSNAKVKHVFFEGAANTAGAYDIGAYYSDGTGDGTALANSGLVIDADFFASAVDLASGIGITDVTNESGTYTAAKRNQPLWQALGLSADPGGYIDIVATSTGTVTVGALMGLEAQYVE